MANELSLAPTYWASVSGGKDSLYMLKLILENPHRYPLNGVVHFELEIDYPFVNNVIDHMENMCKKIRIPFVRITPRTSYWDLYERYGFPTRVQRWCNSMYKMDAKRQLESFMKDQGYYVVHYIGYCYDEVRRYEKRNKNEVYPLVEARIDEAEIWEWAKNVPEFNDYYKFNRRCGCMFCPLSSMTEHAYLLKYYPDAYETLMAMAKSTELEKERRYGKHLSVWDGNPKYDTDYRDRRIREKYLPEIEKHILKEEH